MKVFQVITESINDDNSVVEQVQYVTNEVDSLLKVTEFFTNDCLTLDMELRSVKEVLVIVQHIESKD